MSDNPFPSACEWDPENNRPAQYIPGKGPEGYSGCKNPATVVLGSHTTWRLCEECSHLPRFSRLRKRLSLDRRTA